jgi:hypothetical protein
MFLPVPRALLRAYGEIGAYCLGVAVIVVAAFPRTGTSPPLVAGYDAETAMSFAQR